MAKEADARTALKALFASGAPAKPKPADEGEAATKQAAGKHDPWNTVKAGMALRHLFRVDIQKALHSSKAASRMEEMHGQINKLLDQVAPENASKVNGENALCAIGPAWTRGEVERPAGMRDMGSWTKAVYTEEQQRRLNIDETGMSLKADSGDMAESNQDGAKAGAEPRKPGMSGMSFKPPARKGTTQMIDIALQTDPLLAPMRFKDPPASEVPPPVEPPPEETRRLKLIFQENHREADNMRNNVKQARSRLQVLDAETTRLTRELKMCRKALWEQQREQSNTDEKISSIIAQKTADLDKDEGAELVRLADEERALAQELSEARQVAGKWSNIARRQEEMLKQERDQAKEDDVHKILLRHPAGEVFLPPMLPNDGSDDMSDDEYYRDGPRHPFNRRRDEEEPTLESSDEDAYGSGRPQQDRTPPPPPTQQWRAPLTGDADKESEGGSSVTSPSGSESLRGSPQAADAGRGRMLGSNAPASASALSGARREADSSSSSEDEFDKAKTPAAVSKTPAAEEDKPREAMKTTPPLPGLSGGGSRAQVPTLSVDSAEEISSEEGLDTSRSI